MTASDVSRDTKSVSDPVRASHSARYFKTGPGQYGEGDKFHGLSTPKSQNIAAKYKDLSLTEIKKLLQSPYHEDRIIAVIILVHQFAVADPAKQKQIYDLYLSSTDRINNWDLVDISAPKIVGRYLSGKPRTVLHKLAKSNNLWDRRVAVLSTFWFIRDRDFSDALQIGELLLFDKHDLIHKAVGWMLREIGNRNLKAETDFLDQHVHHMPRTMLRYAIEKFPEKLRRHYLVL